jgi:hypothetical protein
MANSAAVFLSLYFIWKNIAHEIPAGRLGGQPGRSLERPAREDRTVGCQVTQGYPFPGPGEDHAVVAHDIPSPQHGEANLALAPQGAALVGVHSDLIELLIAALGRRLTQR